MNHTSPFLYPFELVGCVLKVLEEHKVVLDVTEALLLRQHLLDYHRSSSPLTKQVIDRDVLRVARLVHLRPLAQP
jgi:hypothetical protein